MERRTTYYRPFQQTIKGEMAKDSIEKSETILACLGGIILVVFAAIMAVSLSGCGSGGSDKSDSTVIAPSQSTCVAGDTVVTVPSLDEVEDIVAEAEDAGEQAIVEEVESGGLDQSGALRLGYKITIIGSCNDIHTEDNDVVSDDDTNVQLGQQQQ